MVKTEDNKAKTDASSSKKKRYTSSTTKFQGRCEEFKDYVFDTDPRNADKFTIVQEELARYIGANFEHGDLISQAVRKLEAPKLERPEDPGKDTDTVAEAIFKEPVKDYIREAKTLKRNIKKAYKVVWGQSSKVMQEKLRGAPNFADFDKQQDVIMLLKATKACMHKFDHRKYQHMAVADVINWFWNLFQGEDMPNLTFLEKFKALVTVVKEHQGNLAIHPSLVNADTSDTDGMSGEELAEWQETSEEKFLACCFMKKICRVRYERLIEELHNNYLLGRCSYPMTVTNAYDLINGYQDRSRHRTTGNTTNGALSFSTVGAEKEDSDKEVVPPANGGKTREEIKCHQCH
eukprot:15365573-Ditylum_brightwellii.AAC.1